VSRFDQSPPSWAWNANPEPGKIRTEAVLVLETILGSDAGTDDPVGVALDEAIADGAW
jgi:hypothetical protein